MKNNTKKAHGLDDLETQYLIATGHEELYSDKREYEQALKEKTGMLSIYKERVYQEWVKQGKAPDKKPLFKHDASAEMEGYAPLHEFDDGVETKKYQDSWERKGEDYRKCFKPWTEEEEKKLNEWIENGRKGVCPVEAQRLTEEEAKRLTEESSQYYNPMGGSPPFHEDLIIDVEAEIIRGLEKYARRRTEKEVSILPDEYKDGNMEIFSKYDITRTTNPRKRICAALMDFYNKIRKFEMHLFKRNKKGGNPKLLPFHVMEALWIGRKLDNLLTALEFEKHIFIGMIGRSGLDDTRQRRRAVKLKKSGEIQKLIDEYMGRNFNSSQSDRGILEYVMDKYNLRHADGNVSLPSLYEYMKEKLIAIPR